MIFDHLQSTSLYMHFNAFGRFKTREVKVGSIGVGGNNPVRIQSMTTSSTRDVQATIDQIICLSDAGCEIARVTVQGMKEAEACEAIKNGLVARGCLIPVVADIHFYPPAALRVVECVDKVRINPGNFVDKRAQFKVIEYTDALYAQELERLEERFAPLVERCKALKKALRIGTNHGSLSDRILNRYGDTPFGMVESAFEFGRICRKFDFHDIIFSMKASNPIVMIEAYRLLVNEMKKNEWDYPLHLGVTEAGEGEDGRVKSSIGIGTLLLEGIGDTIRVSLTEDPWQEIDPGKRLIAFAEKSLEQEPSKFERSIITKRKPVLPSFFHRDGTVALCFDKDIQHSSFFSSLGCSVAFNRVKRGSLSPDLLIGPLSQEVKIKLEKEGIFSVDSLPKVTEEKSTWEKLLVKTPEAVLFSPSSSRISKGREFFNWLKEKKLNIAVLLNFSYNCLKEDLIIQAASECGSLLCDGMGEGLCLEGPYSLDLLRSLSFAILQGARKRTSKTEFISCPGCGRTLFDLQKVSEEIRKKTAHLPGVKIAIMGCIVNGPGEMADADFGYVGSKPGKIDLYVGKHCVERDIDHKEAVDRLVELLKKHHRWKEPEEVAACLSV